LSISTNSGSSFTNYTTSNGLGNNNIFGVSVTSSKLYVATFGGGLSFCSDCTNPTSGGTIAAAQSGTSPFNPDVFTSSVTPSGYTGTLEYKWQSSITNSSTGFSDISSSNSDIYDASALTVTTWFKRLARVDCSADWTGAVESNVLEVTVTSLLPVSGIELNGTATDKQVKLAFKALNEREMDNYVIERSLDGTNFTNIGLQQPLNASQVSASYNFVDNQPIVGNNYYRIKGSSKNGQIQYSNIVVVKYNTNAASVSVVPNPIQGKRLQLKLSQMVKGNYNISVIDIFGRTLLQKEMLLDGNGSLQLNLPNSLKAGNYLVKVEGKGSLMVEKFVFEL